MKPELIVMLTHHDETVKNARQLFHDLKDTPVKYWGFKDIGLAEDQMKALVREMKDAGKITCLEVVSLSEQDGLAGAKLAVQSGFDYLMGTVYFESIGAFLKDKSIQYFPFPGKVYGHPSILGGTLEEIVAHAQWLEKQDVHGLDLLTYRFQGDAFRLLCEVIRSVQIPVVSAGSIASFKRIAEVWRANAWGFTIGSAFFDGAFVPNAGFADNLYAVIDWMQKTDESSLAQTLNS